MPESKKKKLEDAEEVILNPITPHCVPVQTSCIKFVWILPVIRLQEEEQSILAEDEGVVQVPLGGYT